MKKKYIFTAVCLLLALAAAAAGFAAIRYRSASPTFDPGQGSKSNSSPQTSTQAHADLSALALKLSSLSGREITAEILKNLGSDAVSGLEKAAEGDSFTAEECRAATGFTINALVDKYSTFESKDMGSNGSDSFTVGFTGDINFTETGYVMTHAKQMPGGVLDCIDRVFQDEMRSADIMLINNEFPYSDRGAPTPGKKYTFRADPENVHYLNDLGVDVVSLANNHASDYGSESFIDTVETLRGADIPYVGAGMDIDEAKRPVSFIINGYKVSFLACCGVESPIKTPLATEDSAGILGSYDNGETMAQAIREAKQTSDFVIAYPHWGIENTTSLTNAQQVNSKKWIDAGADAVIGGHPHVLQGFEFYKGAPIAYSLGNFWFNTRTVYTGLLKLTFGAGGITTSFVPGIQSGSETHYLEDASARRNLYDTLEGYQPFNKVKIDDSGVITPTE